MRAVVLVVALAAATFAAPPASKQLSGPPSEFARYAIPSPAAAAVVSHTRVFSVHFSPTSNSPVSDNTATWKHMLNVDSNKAFGFSIYTPVAANKLSVTLLDPAGRPVNLFLHAQKAALPLTDGAQEVFARGMTYFFKRPKSGIYTVSVAVPTAALAEADFSRARRHPIHNNASRPAAGAAGDQTEHALLVLYNENTEAEVTHLSTNTLVVGQQIGLVARIAAASASSSSSSSSPSLLPTLKDVVTQAEMEVTYPDGHVVVTPMHDDGLHSDGAADDGVFGASILASQPGIYVLQADLDGASAAASGPFSRSSSLLAAVVPATLRLLGNARAAFDPSSERLLVVLGADSTAATAAVNYRVYAQVWGRATGNASEAVPICWSSTITTVAPGQASAGLTLEVDAKWLAKAGAQAPFELRDVYAEEANGFVPVATAASMPVAGPAPRHAQALTAKLARLVDEGYAGSIDLEMRRGIMPAVWRERARNASLAAQEGTLVMMHGHCTQRNPWTLRAEDFDNAFYYLYPGSPVSASHDELARGLLAELEAQGITKYSIIGYSQGGAVAVHALSFYWTSLDIFEQTDCRKIQSVATPYEGNSLSGFLQQVLNLLPGCDENADLGRDGAVRWVASLSQEAIDASNRYTAQYETGLFKGTCFAGVNLVLSTPNDGAVELAFASLPGGNQLANVEGYCHGDMEFPAAFTNVAQNKEMNALACR